MENEIETQTTQEHTNLILVVTGLVIVALVGVGAYLLRPKTEEIIPTPATSQLETRNSKLETLLPTPIPGPITKLGCERQYYNPVIAKPQYYLSVEGVDINGTASVTCTTTVSVSGKVVATDEATSEMTSNAARGGNTFRCVTKGLELSHTVPSKVDVTLLDNLQNKATCSAIFSLPKP